MVDRRKCRGFLRKQYAELSCLRCYHEYFNFCFELSMQIFVSFQNNASSFLMQATIIVHLHLPYIIIETSTYPLISTFKTFVHLRYMIQHSAKGKCQGEQAIDRQSKSKMGTMNHSSPSKAISLFFILNLCPPFHLLIFFQPSSKILAYFPSSYKHKPILYVRIPRTK